MCATRPIVVVEELGVESRTLVLDAEKLSVDFLWQNWEGSCLNIILPGQALLEHIDRDIILLCWDKPSWDMLFGGKLI